MRLAIAFVFVTALLAAGCSGSGSSAAPALPFKTPQEALNMLKGDWVLQQLNGVDVSSLIPAGGKAPTLTVKDDGQVAGFAGVNRYSSKLDLQNLAAGDFNIGNAAMTRMAGPPQLMKLEDDFTNALNEVTKFGFSGKDLDLKRGSETLLKFVRGG